MPVGRAPVAADPAIEEAVDAFATELRDAANAFAERAREFLDAAFDGSATGAIGDRPPKNLETIAAPLTEAVAPAQTSTRRAAVPHVQALLTLAPRPPIGRRKQPTRR